MIRENAFRDLVAICKMFSIYLIIYKSLELTLLG